jgi:site-specific DNA recombinase
MTEPFDTSQPFGEFVMGILAMVAGYERDSLLMRTTEGRRRKAREGYWTGGRAPLGYRVVDGHLEIDEEEAELIRRIFYLNTEERLSGWQIASLLNAEGVLTQEARRGFTTKRIKHENHWDYTRVLSIIKNETYAGVRHVEKRGKGSIISQPVPAIVSREVWEQAQRLTHSNWANAPRNAKRDYLLRGLLFCSVCGRRYIGYVTNSGKNAYYKCGRQECENRAMPAELAENIIWQDILWFVHHPAPALEKLQQQMALTTNDDIQAEVNVMDAALARLNEERQRILYRIRKGLVSDDEAGQSHLIGIAP